ncbi:autophagocytosis associated protein [Rhodotorula diobovata]|uniref:Autophagy-related protein 3 n=1 Tax=Rhodotorula diobovata TaxID=5288 RepID=A0A5C5G2R3_9BASI|nr:autophagocytosis associated protein [Rhodotorula diobovata]
MLGSIQTHFWAVRDYLSPVLKDSKFKESGRITPDEFVAAGDFLAYKFPTWQWEAGDPHRARDFLPSDKQYLVSRNVPCLRRVSQLGQQAGGAPGDEYAEMLMAFADGDDDAEDGDEWVATHTNAQDPNSTTEVPTIGDIPDLDDDDEPSSSPLDGVSSSLARTSLSGGGAAKDPDAVPDLDDIPDMDDDDVGGAGLVEEDEDDAAVVQPEPPSSRSDKLMQVRTYDCMITYDKYYQTPRMWLLGYDEHKRPLPPTSALADVSSDHALKTVTIEPFPHAAHLAIASVHPCRHSSVMKRVIERMDGNVREMQRRARRAEGAGAGEEKGERKGARGWLGLGGRKKDREAARDATAQEGGEEEDEGLRVEQYLLVFLKFISTITPTIEVDSTASI